MPCFQFLVFLGLISPHYSLEPIIFSNFNQKSKSPKHLATLDMAGAFPMNLVERRAWTWSTEGLRVETQVNNRHHERNGRNQGAET